METADMHMYVAETLSGLVEEAAATMPTGLNRWGELDWLRGVAAGRVIERTVTPGLPTILRVVADHQEHYLVFDVAYPDEALPVRWAVKTWASRWTRTTADRKPEAQS